jgi:CysZ protein
MLTAYFRAIGQLFESRIIKLVGWSVCLSIAVFLLVWTGVAWLIANTTIAEWPVVEWIADILSGLGTIVATFFLFPVVMSAMVALVLEPVARAVEARHYPQAQAAKGLPILAAVAASLRFLLKALLVHLVLLVFLLFPIAYPFAWLAANAYLLSREYFELVALRHVDATTARTLRKQHGASVLLGGVVAAGLFAIPAVNLIAPVVVTMAMVHSFHRWRAA